jgi:asparagine synthase (glutamine-hydrolysing)
MFSFSEMPLLAHVNARGSKVLLTGLWSDQFFFGLGYLVDLVVKLAWRDVGRHLHEYTNWFVEGDATYFRARFYRELFLNLTPRALRSWMRPFRTAIVTPRRLACVSRSLTARVRRRRPRIGHPRYGTAHARNIYQTVRGKSRRLQFEVDEKMAARFGIERLTPFLDRDVIAFLMSIPGEVQNRDGVPRALLRDAMRGIVPEPILRRRWRDEGVTPRLASLSPETRLHACKRLGFSPDVRLVDTDSSELIGLEFWSRAFFSDRLSRPLE